MSIESRAAIVGKRLARLLIVAVAGSGGVAMAYEEPAYEVVRSTEDYEIRRYEPFIVAETRVSGDFGTAGSEAFRILAGYIFGKNKARNIALAAPEDEGESIRMAMTVPVFSSESMQSSEVTYTYGFVMPSEFSMDSLPVPLDARVQLRVVPERTVAVRRYSGRWSEQKFEDHASELLRLLTRDGIRSSGTAQFARYNGPWTPWFFRRNEVMVAIADS